MRAVFWKEFRELGFVALLLAIAFSIGHAEARPARWLPVAFAGGLLVGAAHALLDRVQRRDSFYRHRPLSSLRFHVARSAVGVIAASLPALAYHLRHQLAGLAQRSDPPTLAVALALSLLGWAAMRSALTARVPFAALLFVTLPWLAAQFVEFTASAALAAVLGTVLALRTTLALSGGAR